MSGPGLNQSFHQRQTQQLVLAPQMRQSLKILQVAALDLRATIQEGLQSNPTLEELPMDDVSLEKEAGNGEDKTAPADDAREEMDFSKDFQVLEKILRVQ
jgi:RNA polymerase sigma-54 factor